MGIAAVTIGMIFVGLSWSYAALCFVRLLIGIVSAGVIGGMKAMIADCTDKESGPKAFGMLSVGWGLGTSYSHFK